MKALRRPKRPAFGEDHLDDIVPSQPALEPAPGRPSSARRKESYYLPTELVDRLKNTVVALCGPPEMLTASGLVETAILRELARLEKEHNGGRPFPQRATGPRRGRPIGS
jgi:hypothetical protein